MTAQLTLQPVPRAAGEARQWVRQEFAERERLDLVDAAVLGVSELVTNAVLHVRGNISIQVVESGDRLQVEVYDDSPHSPEGSAVLKDREVNPPTVGRGLQIVDSISLAWGVAYQDEGKCVWFQPVADGGPNKVERGNQTALADDVDESAAADSRPDVTDLVDVEIVDLPVKLLIHYRTRFRDLRREMTLIALDPESTSSVAHRLADVATRLDTYRRFGATSEKQVDDAVDAGRDRITLHVAVPRAVVPGVVELIGLLKETDEFCREQQLLTLASGPQEREMRSWYLGEVVRQAAGEPPKPWAGEFVVTDTTSLPTP